MVGIERAARQDLAAVRISLLTRFSELKTKLQNEDWAFLKEILNGIVYTHCSGARLSSPEKEHREWRLPAGEFVHFNRILSITDDDSRTAITTLISDAAGYGTRMAEEGLAIMDISDFLVHVESTSKRTFG